MCGGIGSGNIGIDEVTGVHIGGRLDKLSNGWEPDGRVGLAVVLDVEVPELVPCQLREVFIRLVCPVSLVWVAQPFYMVEDFLPAGDAAHDVLDIIFLFLFEITHLP